MGGEELKMRNEELKKVLKELNQKLGKILEETSDGFSEIIANRLSEAHNEKCELSIKKDKNGKAKIVMEGSTLAILITLAGLEKTVLEKTHVPSEVWEMIKSTVGTREND